MNGVQIFNYQDEQAMAILNEGKEAIVGQLREVFDSIDSRTLSDIYASALAYNEPMKFCIYFIKNEYTGEIKIGRTNNVWKRMQQLRSCFSHLGMEQNHLKLIAVVLTFDRYLSNLEKYFHQHFASHRHIGEWFGITEDDVYEVVLHSEVEIIDDIVVAYGDYEWEFFKSINKSYQINLYDMHAWIDQSYDDFSLFIKKNQLIEILKVIEKNKVGFCREVAVENGLRRVGVRFEDQEPITFSELKRRKFKASPWGQRALSLSANFN